ncbi:hypothetical protein BLNAU_19751 [Blattamonas nauphoetae]|uniref:Uncharacterized protein n=1 Tax=Blattamonas nauphoetae TaxID=2049346 RepID=A0ABQ9X0K8_9EUKA|nr:hypothetical protein BLNAU_19751 [Blattamonas nauphoetae]
MGVGKGLLLSLSIFNQSAQDYNRSPTTPHEAESKADKADTLFEMIMVQSGVEVRLYPHSRGSIPPPLVHVVPGKAGKFSPMLASCGVLALSSDFLKLLLHLSETILTVSERLPLNPAVILHNHSRRPDVRTEVVDNIPDRAESGGKDGGDCGDDQGIERVCHKRAPHNDRSEEGNHHKYAIYSNHNKTPVSITSVFYCRLVPDSHQSELVLKESQMTPNRNLLLVGHHSTIAERLHALSEAWSNIGHLNETEEDDEE